MGGNFTNERAYMTTSRLKHTQTERHYQSKMYGLKNFFVLLPLTFKCQPYKMVKHTQTARLRTAN